MPDRSKEHMAYMRTLWKGPNLVKRELKNSPPSYQEMISKVLAVDYSKGISKWRKPLLAMMILTGARIGELIKVKKKDIRFYDSSNKEIVDWRIDVSGCSRMEITLHTEKLRKGNKLRIVPIVRNALFEPLFPFIIDNWKDAKLPDDYLHGQHNGRTNPIGRKSVNLFIKKNIDSNWFPHLFRHASTTEDMRAGVGLETVRKKYGWRSYNMITTTYSHLNTSDMVRDQVKAFGEPVGLVKPIVKEVIPVPVVVKGVVKKDVVVIKKANNVNKVKTPVFF